MLTTFVSWGVTRKVCLIRLDDKETLVGLQRIVELDVDDDELEDGAEEVTEETTSDSEDKDDSIED